MLFGCGRTTNTNCCYSHQVEERIDTGFQIFTFQLRGQGALSKFWCVFLFLWVFDGLTCWHRFLGRRFALFFCSMRYKQVVCSRSFLVDENFCYHYNLWGTFLHTNRKSSWHLQIMLGATLVLSLHGELCAGLKSDIAGNGILRKIVSRWVRIFVVST